MVHEAQGPEEWILLSTCVARMSELHPIYVSHQGYARRDLEKAIQAGRIVLRGCRPGLTDPTPEVIDGQIAATHRIDLIHNTLSERRPGLSDDISVFRDVEIEWNKTKAYLLTYAVEYMLKGSQGTKAPTAYADMRSLSSIQAKTLAREYIEREKSARQRPTLQGLEKYARDQGLRGGREYLRAEFRKLQEAAGEPLRRGRPKKSPS
jgi:hypothetical protein